MILPALGIDIAKLKFNVCLINSKDKLKHKVFPNSPDGFTQLVAWLAKQNVERVHACMEATGTYGEALAYHLHAAGQRVSVINPAAVKAFAASRLSRTKTDKADAELIARFCQAQQPPQWTPPAPEVRELQALVRRLESLVEMRVAEENRLEAGSAVEAVRASVEAHVAYLNTEIKCTETLIRNHIDRASRLEGTKRAARLYSRHRGDDCCITFSGDRRCHTLQKRTASRRLRRAGAERATFGKFGARTHEALEDR